MKINVLVNDILNRIGSVTIHNVLREADLHLLPVSITPCGAYRKTSIDQNQIDLIDPSDVNINVVQETVLFNKGTADVIVDFSPNSFFRKIIPNYMEAKTSFVLLAGDDEKEDAKNILKVINNLYINVVLLPANSSEQQVIAAIYYLHKKNEENVSGKVFFQADIAA